MAQWVKALAALAGDLGLVSTIYRVAHNHLPFNFRVSSNLVRPLWTLQTLGVYSYVQKLTLGSKSESILL